ncbi:MAG: threonine ammonia-lyase, biosynthetic [Gammaproteobacteria bacterium]|nr:threonine ammonia-lyase, biosynthetic [Gammaproteobacteria bacterium]MYF30512.1 threonine ammonia-lyase, biosynthetic [Gammaproteobacteria bacterium]MYK47592.1 threonine ammonia-lyase, biosynthetic [Gammaproteobacteria bacterium]
MLEPLVKKILASRVYDLAVETPLQNAPNISVRLGHQVALKREDLQPVFSFKLRGAYNKMARLSARDRERGVVAASAGNHAQGVALAAQKLGIRSHIVMGRNTPSIKVDAVRSLGAHIVFQGDTYQQAADHAAKLARTRGYILVHPYDDPDVIAGQGTVGMEIMNQHPGPDAVFVPVGGGGLIAGIAAYIKYLRPETRIVGVEAEGSACLAAALKAGRRVRLPLDSLDVFADGVSVAQIGLAPFKIARDHVDEVVTVSIDEICAAIKDLFDDTRSIAEPAGALAVAGLKKHAEENPRVTGKRYVGVVSGANVNFDRLRHISERAELGEHREAIFGVTIDEQKGSFRRFCRALGKRGVTEFNYRYASDEEAHVYVGLQISPGETRQSVAAGLAEAGYGVTDMTDNEAAKLHVRHMVGGRAFGRKPELLYRFEFPERPGALLRFLNGLGSHWNITMFHYRNHGAAWGRVLAGFEARPADRASLATYLDRIGYRYWEETGNPAVELFLR